MRSTRVATSTAAVHAQLRRPTASSVLDRRIRGFAPGAKNFVPATVVLTRPKGIRPGKPSYDIPDYQKNAGNENRVPLYGRSLKIDHTVTIDKNVKPGTEVRVAGALTYPSCDERVVYPKRTMTVRWTIRVEQHE